MANSFMNLCVSGMLATAALVGTQALADAPANARITLSGLSCLTNPGAADLDDARTKFELEFVDFAANSDSLADSRSTCSLFISARNAQGWQFRIKTAKYSHDTILGRGGKRTTQTSYHFQGSAETTSVSSTMTGPIQAIGYTTVHNVQDGAWSPCGAGRSLVLTPSTVVNTDADASVEIKTAQIELEWKRCQ